MNWEYLTIRSWGLADTELNMYGFNGWELVTILATEGFKKEYFFKRPFPDVPIIGSQKEEKDED